MLSSSWWLHVTLRRHQQVSSRKVCLELLQLIVLLHVYQDDFALVGVGRHSPQPHQAWQRHPCCTLAAQVIEQASYALLVVELVVVVVQLGRLQYWCSTRDP